MYSSQSSAMRRLVEPDLLNRLRPGTPHGAAFRTAVQGCFGLAEDVASERRNLSLDESLNAAARKEELKRLAEGHLMRNLADLTRPARRLKAHLQAQKAEIKHGPMPSDLVALNDDIAIVEAAMYFARRELEPACGTTGVSFDLLLSDLDAAADGARA